MPASIHDKASRPAQCALFSSHAWQQVECIVLSPRHSLLTTLQQPLQHHAWQGTPGRCRRALSRRALSRSGRGSRRGGAPQALGGAQQRRGGLGAAEAGIRQRRQAACAQQWAASAGCMKAEPRQRRACLQQPGGSRTGVRPWQSPAAAVVSWRCSAGCMQRQQGVRRS